MLQNIVFVKVPVTHVPLDKLVGFLEPKGPDETVEVESEMLLVSILDRYTGEKREVLELITEGLNWNEASAKLHINQSKVYKFKREFQVELKFLKDLHDQKQKSGVPAIRPL